MTITWSGAPGCLGASPVSAQLERASPRSPGVSPSFPSFSRVAPFTRQPLQSASIFPFTLVVHSQMTMTKSVYCNSRMLNHISVPKMHRATRKSAPKLAAKTVIGRWP